MAVVADRAERSVALAHDQRRNTMRGGGMLSALSACVLAYGYGSIPFVYLLGRWRHVDLRERGSGNVGASNLWKASGSRVALVGWIADASKGLVPAIVARRLGCSRATSDMAAVCGVAGQCWPLFLGLRGGRGISAFVGAALWINPRAWAASLLPIIGGSLWRIVTSLGPRYHRMERQLKATRSKSVPFGCFLGVTSFPIVCQLFPGRERGATFAPTLLTTVIVLRRLTARLPDDATHGPAIRLAALWYRLLYDRNTSE